MIKQKTVSGARTAKIVISELMCLAVRHSAVTINPIRETARIEGTPQRKPRAMTAGERQQWFAALEASAPARLWDSPDLSLMMLTTGCRIGECLAISWDEINLDQATVDICWRLVRRTGAGLLQLVHQVGEQRRAADPATKLGGDDDVRSPTGRPPTSSKSYWSQGTSKTKSAQRS